MLELRIETVDIEKLACRSITASLRVRRDEGDKYENLATLQTSTCLTSRVTEL